MSRAIHQVRMATGPVARARRDAAPKGEPSFGKAVELGLLLDGSEPPLRQALEKLSRRKRSIAQSFRRLLGQLDPRREEYRALLRMDPLACYRPLAQKDGPATRDVDAYREAVERAAATLIRSGVPEDHAIAAVGLHLEASLDSLERREDMRALVRLASATQWLIAAAYCEDRIRGLRSLDDRERQKLSGDLHDEVGADLVVLKLYVEMISNELAKGSRTLGPKLDEALALIAHAIESVRRLTLDLGPAFLDTLGFVPAVRHFIRQFSERTGIEVVLREQEPLSAIPASHETALYRVLLGALSNIAKHSQARRATVTLRDVPGGFAMSIEDDGRGFNVESQSPQYSFGLTAMRERIRGLRGRLSITSRKGRARSARPGTRVEVRLPARGGASS